jgi:hypothetical protein
MSFDREPDYTHGTVARTAVLLVNLGTPEAPEPGAVRRYLRQFLSDPRVVEIPRAVWLPLLHGVILTVRPRKSAAKYATIWTEKGSPLSYHSEQQALLLRGYLGERNASCCCRCTRSIRRPRPRPCSTPSTPSWRAAAMFRRCAWSSTFTTSRVTSMR